MERPCSSRHIEDDSFSRNPHHILPEISSISLTHAFCSFKLLPFRHRLPPFQNLDIPCCMNRQYYASHIIQKAPKQRKQSKGGGKWEGVGPPETELTLSNLQPSPIHPILIRILGHTTIPLHTHQTPFTDTGENIARFTPLGRKTRHSPPTRLAILARAIRRRHCVPYHVQPC